MDQEKEKGYGEELAEEAEAREKRVENAGTAFEDIVEAEAWEMDRVLGRNREPDRRIVIQEVENGYFVRTYVDNEQTCAAVFVSLEELLRWQQELME